MAGPRGDHSRDEFIALVVGAAEAIARQEGLRGLGLRRIASAIGYAPNSIYSAVGDLDTIVLHVNARTLERLCGHLEGAIAQPQTTAAATRNLAQAYLDIVFAEPKLWTLLFEHVLPEGHAHPDWFVAALRRPTSLVDAVLAPLIGDAAGRADAVAVLWAGVHGLAALAASGKLAAVSDTPPRVLADLLVGRFLAGVAQAADDA